MTKLLVFGPLSVQSSNSTNYYRSLYKNLADLGFEITCARPASAALPAQCRSRTADGFAGSVTYEALRDLPELLCHSHKSDLVIHQLGDGRLDLLLADWLLDSCPPNTQLVLWDGQAPSTLEALATNALHPLRRLLPDYDRVLISSGGPAAVASYLALGARDCQVVYPGLDTTEHYPVPADPRFACDLLFAGDHSAESARRVRELFVPAARRAPEYQFNLLGAGWEDEPLPQNVRRMGAPGAGGSDRAYCSARMVLSLNCEAREHGTFSPPACLFEAAGAGACVVSDRWPGMETFFEPGCEILMARDAGEIVDLLRTVDIRLAREIGKAMRKRAHLEHTYALRALALREILRNAAPLPAVWRERQQQTA